MFSLIENSLNHTYKYTKEIEKSNTFLLKNSILLRKNYFTSMEPTFDLQKFLTRKNIRQRELSQRTGLSIGMVGMMAAGKSKPSYETIGKLIECGMSIQEIFGDDVAQILLENSDVKSEKLSKEDFMAGVREALAEISRTGK